MNEVCSSDCPDYRRLRRALGLSLDETARRAEVSLAWLSRFERGYVRRPDPDRVKRVVDVLLQARARR
jgi:transcriptional regulator with XRE-family HTH domain